MKKEYTMYSFSGRISGKRNRISGRIPDIKKDRISGATLYSELIDYRLGKKRFRSAASQTAELEGWTLLDDNHGLLVPQLLVLDEIPFVDAHKVTLLTSK